MANISVLTGSEGEWVVVSKNTSFVKGVFVSRQHARDYIKTFREKFPDRIDELRVAYVKMHDRKAIDRISCWGCYEKDKLIKITHNEVHSKLFKHHHLHDTKLRRKRWTKRLWLEVVPKKV